MRNLKFNGVLEEILEQYPNIDIAGFLVEKLEIPEFKAEELAGRIEKEYCKKALSRTGQNLVKDTLEEPSKSEQSSQASAYCVEGLSEKEFEHFIKWLLDELGYEVHPAKFAAALGVDLVAMKEGEKISVQARKYPVGMKASNSIVLMADQAKRVHDCNRCIVIATTDFTRQAMVDAQKLGVELWDKEVLSEKISEVRKNAEVEEQSCFPPYKGSLLQSLLRLEETKDFMIEPRADEKFDLHLPGVKFPLLTFQACGDEVIQCVFRIKYNEPVGEFDGEALIRSDRNNNRLGPDGIDAYALIVKYRFNPFI
jgi:hypothetical protein